MRGARRAWPVVAAVAAAASAGCSAQLLETRRPVQGPVEAVGWLEPGGGHARYAASGGRWLVAARRRDALEKIAGFCGGAGKYRIVDEVDREEAETPFTSQDLEDNLKAGEAHYRKAAYRHLYFECAH